MRTIIINSSNYVVGSGNEFEYKFPNSVKFDVGDRVGLSGIAVYNSSFNITSAYGNNVITIKWNADSQSSFTFIIPDGYYSISDLNYYIQSQCIANNLYVSNSSGMNIYFIELVVNPTRYAVSLNLYALPTASQASTMKYVKPTDALWNFPSTAKCPQITISNALGNLIGQNAGIYPSSDSVALNQQYLSTKTPKLNIIDSYILTCNLINNKYAIPSDVFFSVPLTGSIGSLISSNPSSVSFNDIATGTYNSIKIRFFSQDFDALLLRDTQCTIMLSIKSKDE
jgi:hypothetical protein